MCEITEEMRIALNEKTPLLVGISPERIRDEFLKGLKSTNSTVFFLEMLDSFNLFDWIFPNITLNKKFIEDKDPMIIIASLMKFNKFGDCLKKQFNKLSYSSVEICQIEFLVNLSNLNMDNVVAFKKTFKTSKISNNQLKSMGTREGMSIELLDAFENFELSVKGEDVMKKFNLQPGKELGDRIIVLETENFRKLIYNY